MKDESQIPSGGASPAQQAHDAPIAIAAEEMDALPVKGYPEKESPQNLSSKPASGSSDDSSSDTDVEATAAPLTRVKTIDDECPDGGYGWVCVACVFMINAHTWGINSV